MKGKQPFDDNGMPNTDIHEFTNKLEDLTYEFLKELVDEHEYNATEIRAISAYIINAVGLAESGTIFDIRDKILRERRKNSDPNLSEDEKTLIISSLDEDDATRGSYKIQTIRKYRERTGFGLREAKEAVEKWMRENL
jgi:ribosomal protein L7/L12